MITEIGGTVGDIESLPFLEAIRQFPVDVGRRNCMFIHLTLVPYIGHAGELKTKPTQHSVNELRRIGIQPDMLHLPLRGRAGREIRKKIALFASLPIEAVISAQRRRQHLQGAALLPGRGRRRLHARPLRHRGAPRRPRLSRASIAKRRRPRAASRCASRSSASTSQLEDAYLSVVEALRHAGFHARRAASRSTGSTPRRSTTARSRRAARGRRRHPDPRRLRRPRHRGQDPRRADRARAADPVPRHLPRHADRGRRVRPPRRRHGRRELDRVRPRDAVPGDRPAARAEGGRRHGRHDAPRRRPGQAARGHARARDLRRGRRSTSVTATATRSTTTCASGSRRPAWSSPARRRTSASSRSIELADHPFFVASQYHPEFKSRPERPAPLFREFVGAAQRYARRAGAVPRPSRSGWRAQPRRPASASRAPVRPASEAEKAG